MEPTDAVRSGGGGWIRVDPGRLRCVVLGVSWWWLTGQRGNRMRHIYVSEIL